MSQDDQPQSGTNSVTQEVKDSKSIVQVARDYIKGVPGWFLFILSLLLGSSIFGSVWYVTNYLNRDSSIEVIDVSVIETEEFPIVEFRLRNIGGKVSYIKTAQFEILDHRSINLCGFPHVEPVSWTYDVNLSTEGFNHHIQSKKIDQVIPANGTDRFQFRISSKDSGISNLYLLKMNLIYNTGNDNRVSSEPLIVEIPFGGIDAWTSYGGKIELECVKSNIENTLYMISLSGVKSGRLAKLQRNVLEQNLREVEQALREDH